MAPIATQYAESLLEEAVLLIYGAFRTNDFPEHYVRCLAPATLRARLYELRTQRSRMSLGRLPSDEEGYLRLFMRAEEIVATALSALWAVDPRLAEHYVTTAAQAHMTACLRRFREEETDSDRAALVGEVTRLRALIGEGPITWEEIVNVVSIGC
jgi:hypothetical protein